MKIKPTRSELLKARKRIKLARRGHELLKKKQDSLVMEFFRLLKDVKAHRAALQERYALASDMLREARALESDLRIRAAGIAVAQHAPLEISVRNIAGVRLPEITMSRIEVPVSDSVLIQDLRLSYHAVISEIVALAAKETALRKVLLEIRKVKRRAYALEHVFIPQLESEVQRVRLTLEERGREEFVRLKRRKHEAEA